MGKKDVQLTENQVVVSSYKEAFDVTDPNVRVYNEDTLLTKELSRQQYVNIKTNYVGVINSLEVTYSNTNDLGTQLG